MSGLLLMYVKGMSVRIFPLHTCFAVSHILFVQQYYYDDMIYCS